jgi:hypothetical protein
MGFYEYYLDSMKADSNIEIDRLLRRFAVRKGDASAKVPSGNRTIEDNVFKQQADAMEHLDADELIAYAENVLPAATRLRYAAHLSECDSCRKLVTDLVLASGASVTQKAQTTIQGHEEKRSWRDWLAAMFAPRVLRYAASVILLVGITSIAFIIFRDGRKPNFGSLNQDTDTSAANQNAPVVSAPNSGTQSKTNGEQNRPSVESDSTSREITGIDATKTTQEVPKDVPAESQQGGREQEPPKPSGPVTTDSIYSEAPRGQDEVVTTGNKQQPAVGASAADANLKKREADRSESTVRDARASSGRADAEESKNDDDAKLAQSKVAAVAKERVSAARRARGNSEPAPAPPPPSQGMIMNDSRDKASGAGKAEESRVVSGRQFRRRNGAWVDVAYQSQATTSVKRGSDQYRALVADEPGLRAVASQLGGDVIVVWKGRAYRFH